MADKAHGRAWRAGHYIGLVSDEPRPKAGSRAWWLSIAVSVGCGALAVFVLDRLG